MVMSPSIFVFAGETQELLKQWTSSSASTNTNTNTNTIASPGPNTPIQTPKCSSPLAATPKAASNLTRSTCGSSTATKSTISSSMPSHGHEHTLADLERHVSVSVSSSSTMGGIYDPQDSYTTSSFTTSRHQSASSGSFSTREEGRFLSGPSNESGSSFQSSEDDGTAATPDQLVVNMGLMSFMCFAPTTMTTATSGTEKQLTTAPSKLQDNDVIYFQQTLEEEEDEIDIDIEDGSSVEEGGNCKVDPLKYDAIGIGSSVARRRKRAAARLGIIQLPIYKELSRRRRHSHHHHRHHHRNAFSYCDDEDDDEDVVLNSSQGCSVGHRPPIEFLSADSKRMPHSCASSLSSNSANTRNSQGFDGYPSRGREDLDDEDESLPTPQEKMIVLRPTSSLSYGHACYPAQLQQEKPSLPPRPPRPPPSSSSSSSLKSSSKREETTTTSQALAITENSSVVVPVVKPSALDELFCFANAMQVYDLDDSQPMTLTCDTGNQADNSLVCLQPTASGSSSAADTAATTTTTSLVASDSKASIGVSLGCLQPSVCNTLSSNENTKVSTVQTVTLLQVSKKDFCVTRDQSPTPPVPPPPAAPAHKRALSTPATHSTYELQEWSPEDLDVPGYYPAETSQHSRNPYYYVPPPLSSSADDDGGSGDNEYREFPQNRSTTSSSILSSTNDKNSNKSFKLYYHQRQASMHVESHVQLASSSSESWNVTHPDLIHPADQEPLTKRGHPSLFIDTSLPTAGTEDPPQQQQQQLQQQQQQHVTSVLMMRRRRTCAINSFSNLSLQQSIDDPTISGSTMDLETSSTLETMDDPRDEMTTTMTATSRMPTTIGSNSSSSSSSPMCEVAAAPAPSSHTNNASTETLPVAPSKKQELQQQQLLQQQKASQVLSPSSRTPLSSGNRRVDRLHYLKSVRGVKQGHATTQTHDSASGIISPKAFTFGTTTFSEPSSSTAIDQSSSSSGQQRDTPRRRLERMRVLKLSQAARNQHNHYHHRQQQQ